MASDLFIFLGHSSQRGCQFCLVTRGCHIYSTPTASKALKCERYISSCRIVCAVSHGQLSLKDDQLAARCKDTASDVCGKEWRDCATLADGGGIAAFPPTEETSWPGPRTRGEDAINTRSDDHLLRCRAVISALGSRRNTNLRAPPESRADVAERRRHKSVTIEVCGSFSPAAISSSQESPCSIRQVMRLRFCTGYDIFAISYASNL
ncbi:hypothetical protein PR048_003212 [Dryococelus australis]|uniref:Uncharacterized protein n=1 Tax=Dryococelus australis TaxID=614101 RepID=A0ABQ9IMI0_9NEOP|nr:hypothetical protein PR048_003212 [Dryococelus australis]